MTYCFLALGSNLNSPERQLRIAVKSIQGIPKTKIIAVSSIYKTNALGSSFQPGYCNQVIAIFTKIPPMRLLRLCQHIENMQKRIRKKKGGGRTLDIDILIYGNQIINNSKLQIPHPEMAKRDFVLMPLLEISSIKSLG
jgi:2-amino-4-hydroxy-6-hydroxymethyldihydropteridine diphosphokinase